MERMMDHQYRENGARNIYSNYNQMRSYVKCLRLQLHGAIYRPDSFVLMLRYCSNLKAIRYESTSLNRIVADKSHIVIVALVMFFCLN